MASSSEAPPSGERPAGPAAAVVLAAGIGSRLRPYTVDLPKALIPVGGVTLLERQLERLAAVGVREVVVVGGHGWRSVKALLDAGHESGRWGMNVALAVNDDYRSTGTAHSLRLALTHPGCAEAQEFVVVEGDVLLGAGALERLVDRDAGHDVRILASRRILESSLIRASDVGTVTQIFHAADQIHDAPTDRRSTDFYNLSCYHFAMSRSQLCQVLEESLATTPKANVERVVNGLCGAARVGLAVVSHEWAIEIDTPEDLEVAQRHVEQLALGPS